MAAIAATQFFPVLNKKTQPTAAFFRIDMVMLLRAVRMYATFAAFSTLRITED